MRLLAFDTCMAPVSAAAFGDDGGPLAAQTLPDSVRATEGLVELLGLVVAEAGWRLGEVELVAVTVGPGGFTNLRVGIAVARALALATGCAVLGGTCLEAAAAVHPAAGRPFTLTLDVGRGGWATQDFAPDGAPLADLTVLAGRPAAAVGVLGSWDGGLATAVGAMAMARLAAGDRPAAGSTLRPLYARAPDATPTPPRSAP